MVGCDDDFDRWLKEGYPPAYRTAYLILHDRHDAEEAVQDAFLRAWRFRSALPAGDGQWRPWLYRVVVNACYSKLRDDTRHRWPTPRGTVAAPVPAEEGGGGPEPEVLALASERQKVVLAALRRMPDHLRVVVALRYYAQLNDAEIAVVIRRRPGTVKSRLHEARARLGADPALSALRGDEEVALP